MLPDIGSSRPWTDPEIVSIGRLAACSPLVPHPTADAARSGTRDASPWWRCLNGDWRFQLFDHPDVVPPEAVGVNAAGILTVTRTDGGPSPSRATGPCRASTISPTTRTCRCRSRTCRPSCRHGFRRASIGRRSASRERGGGARSCSTSAGPRAFMPSTSTVRSSGTAPTAGSPASTTSPPICAPAPTSLRSSS